MTISQRSFSAAISLMILLSFSLDSVTPGGDRNIPLV